MPNWCENDLYIYAPDEYAADVAALLALIGADRDPPEFDFNAVIPYPEKWRKMDEEMDQMYEEIRERSDIAARMTYKARLDAYTAKWETEIDGYNSGGYAWCMRCWGVKSNAVFIARRDYDGSVIITFQTAWSPPQPVIAALAARFPTLTLVLEYFERGMGRSGGYRYNGSDDDEPPSEWHATGYRGLRGG